MVSVINKCFKKSVFIIGTTLCITSGVQIAQADTIAKYVDAGEEKAVILGTDTVWLSIDNGGSYISAIVAGKLGNQYILAPEHGDRNKLYLVDKIHQGQEDKKIIWYNDEANEINLDYKPFYRDDLKHSQSILRVLYWPQDGHDYLVVANGSKDIKYYEIKKDLPVDTFQVSYVGDYQADYSVVNLDMIDPEPLLTTASQGHSYNKSLILFVSNNDSQPVQKEHPWLLPFPNKIEIFGFNPTSKWLKYLDQVDFPKKVAKYTRTIFHPYRYYTNYTMPGAVLAPDSDGRLAYFLTEFNASYYEGDSPKFKGEQPTRDHINIRYITKEYPLKIMSEHYLGPDESSEKIVSEFKDQKITADNFRPRSAKDVASAFGHVITPFLHQNNDDLLVMGISLSQTQKELLEGRPYGRYQRINNEMSVGRIKTVDASNKGKFVGTYDNDSTKNILKNKLQEDGASVLAVIYGWPYFASKAQTQQERETHDDSPSPNNVPTMKISQGRVSTKKQEQSSSTSQMVELGATIDASYEVAKFSFKEGISAEFEQKWERGESEEKSLMVNQTREYNDIDHYYAESSKTEGIGGYLNSGMILYTTTINNAKSNQYLESVNGKKYFSVEGTTEPFVYMNTVIASKLVSIGGVNISYFNLENPSELILPDNFNEPEVSINNTVSPLSSGLSGHPFPLLYYRSDDSNIYENARNKIVTWQTEKGLDEIANRFINPNGVDETLKQAIQSIDPENMPDGYIRYSMTESFELDFSDKKASYADHNYNRGTAAMFELSAGAVIGGYAKGKLALAQKWENRWEQGSSTGLKFNISGTPGLTSRSGVLQFFVVVDAPRYKQYLKKADKPVEKPEWMPDWVWENNSTYTFIFPFLPDHVSPEYRGMPPLS